MANNARKSSDPADISLANSDVWTYDGDYDYGSYGFDPQTGEVVRHGKKDPLYGNTEKLPSVFSQNWHKH